MKLLKKYFLLGLFLFFLVKGFAQDSVNDVTENNFMTANGKIYVVMAVVIVIVLGLFLYLINLDKKITKLEKKKE